MKTKPVLVVSLALNVILLAFGVVAQRRMSMQPKAVAPVETVAAAAGSAELPAAKPEVGAREPEPFQWNQLESGDDRSYIRNLRSVGCPESTIRDILGTAVGHRYDRKRDEARALQAKGEIGTVALPETLAQLWDEQNDLMAELFETPRSFGSKGAVAKVATRAGEIPAKPIAEPVTLRSSNSAPLVFLEPDPSWGLSDAQLTIWDQVTDRFAAALGGPGQNPTDPAYYARWQEAQSKADQELRTLFGDSQVSRWQMQSKSRMPPPKE